MPRSYVTYKSVAKLLPRPFINPPKANSPSETSHRDLVPPTVERDDHFGPGSVQLYIPADYDEHYFTMLETGAHNEQFKLLCAFDVVANSTDRKGGHCLLGQDGRIWAIDNGLSFHEVPKLRTVIWEWSEEPVPVEIANNLPRSANKGSPKISLNY